MNPRNGFVSAVWGPPFWFMLHCISLNYPLTPSSEDKVHYQNWFEGLGHVLPCGICRTNFAQNLVDVDYEPTRDFETRMDVVFLVYRLHNQVRRTQGKSRTMTFGDCVRLYEQFRAQDCLPSSPGSEGGCFASQNLTCTLQVSTGENERCRYQIDANCGL